jgi:hypothetical protein
MNAEQAIEAVKQFHARTLDGVPMEVKLVPRNAQQQQQQKSTETKASLFGSALGGGSGRGTGGKDTSFSIVLPSSAVGKAGGKPAAKFEGTCNNCGKTGHKASECRSAKKSAAPAKAKAPAKEAKPKEPKAPPANAANLDDDLDSYFQANKKSE